MCQLPLIDVRKPRPSDIICERETFLRSVSDLVNAYSGSYGTERRAELFTDHRYALEKSRKRGENRDRSSHRGR